MKRGSLLLTLVFFLSLVYVFSSGNVIASEQDSMDISVNLIQPYVSFNVQRSVFLGNLTKGFDSDEDEVGDFIINNTGTTKIRITAELENPSDPIFSNLYLSNSTADDKFRKVDDFSSVMDLPNNYGQSNADKFYAILKLSEYTGDITGDIMGYSTKVIFWASAA
jgi:hypothetical protein